MPSPTLTRSAVKPLQPLPLGGLGFKSLLQALAFLALFVAAKSSSVTKPWEVVALASSDADPTLRLAARDAARYLRLLRCGHGPASAECVTLQLVDDVDVTSVSTTVLVATLGSVPARFLAGTDVAALNALQGDAHAVFTSAAAPVTVCTGATPRATLYAVYSLLESLGARFALSGDLLPQPNAGLELPAAEAAPLLASPIFSRRGLQPFHDFPMGPDWWSADFYKSTATQMQV